MFLVYITILTIFPSVSRRAEGGMLLGVGGHEDDGTLPSDSARLSPSSPWLLRPSNYPLHSTPHHLESPLPSDDTQHVRYLRVCYLAVEPGAERVSQMSEVLPEQLLTAEILDCRLCSHIILLNGVVRVSRSGTSRHSLIEGVNVHVNVGDDTIREYVGKLATCREQENPGLRVLLQVSGSGSEYGEVTRVYHTRRMLEQALVAAARRLGLDGVEVAWQWPQGHRQRRSMTLLLMGLRALIEVEEKRENKEKLILSLMLPAHRHVMEGGYEPQEIGTYVDFVNVQCHGYNLKAHAMFNIHPYFTDHASPLFDTEPLNQFATKYAAWTVSYWVKLGMPRQKIVMVVPFYGSKYTLLSRSMRGVHVPAYPSAQAAPYADAPHSLAMLESLSHAGLPATDDGRVVSVIYYPDACLFIDNGGEKEVDDEHLVPYARHGKEWISFEDETSIAQKSNFVKNFGLAGLGSYPLNADDYHRVCTDVPFPLQRTVHNLLLQN